MTNAGMLASGRSMLIAAGIAAAMLGHAAVAHAGYQAGRGLSLFDDRLIIGGYLAIDASFLDQTPDRVTVDDLSSFITLRLGDQWLLFAEAELEDPVFVGGGGGSGKHIFSLERLYAQWQPVERFRVRAGQMLTPIGIWNSIHASPLVWSTSRPIATEQFFDTGVTGLEIAVFAPLRTTDFTFTAFGQATNHIDETRDPQEARRAFGARVEAAALRGLHLGASFVRFRDRKDHRMETAFGADALWATRVAELSAELAGNTPDSGTTTWGAYVQAVFHVGWRLHPFVRVEYADLGSFDRVPVVPGIAWKPTDTAVFKLEGILGGKDTSLDGNGVLASFSVLF